MDELLGEFVAETRETLEAIAGEIVAWEAAPADRSRLDAIFRFVHTVKGSCGFLDLPRLERLSHAAEDALAQVRSGARDGDSALVTAVLAIIDRIGELVDAIESGGSVSDEDDDRLIAALSPDAVRAEPVAASTPASRAPARSIRLPVELLDRMMGGVSDMVLARNELFRRLREATPDPGLESAFDRLSECVAEMRDAITRTRMQRVENLFTALPRMVRDLSADLGKSVRLDVDGGDAELDREMIEMIRDPLTHIVRNAIDHGIETPAERQAARKPAIGLLRVWARQAGNQILIDIADDGRGIDGERLVRKAIEAGVIGEAQASRMSAAAKNDLIFHPGLSTATAVTAVSGRGVGMDVVRANIERIGGLVEVDSRLGHGLRLTLRVPLTLTIIPALTISTGGHQFAIPRAAIEEIVRTGAASIRMERVGGATMANVRGRRLPVVSLGGAIGQDCSERETTLVILRLAGGAMFALAVEMVHDHEELVVRPAAPAVMAIGLYAGTTLPDNGRPMLLLDVAGIARAGKVGETAEGIADEPAPSPQAPDDRVDVLLFHDLDGAERGIRLALVERIEDVPAAAVSHVAGRLRLVHNGAVLPLEAAAAPPDAPRHRILRLSDGRAEIAYAIGEIIDIAALDPAFVPASEPGPIAGIALVAGRPVELLDTHWLFAGCGGGRSVAKDRPTCVLRGGDDAFTRGILAPLVEAAGYRVVCGDPDGGAAIALVVESGDPAPAPAGGAPVIRLRARAEAAAADDDSIYRYDRAALVAALGRYRGARTR